VTDRRAGAERAGREQLAEPRAVEPDLAQPPSRVGTSIEPSAGARSVRTCTTSRPSPASQPIVAAAISAKHTTRARRSGGTRVGYTCAARSGPREAAERAPVQPSMSPSRARLVPRVLGAVAAVVVLALYGVGLFFVPGVLDWAFSEGGKAPMLVAVIGAALTMGAYFGVETLAARALAR